MSQDVMIRMINIYKSFGDVKVLEGVNLEVKRGEIIAVVGLPAPERAHCSVVSINWN